MIFMMYAIIACEGALSATIGNKEMIAGELLEGTD